MADSDKNILIRPNRGATSQPVITFTGQGNDPITLRVLDGATGTGITAGGALSFEGSAGQLLSVVNRLDTGSIFSVNDISGIPSIDVDANGTIEFAPFTGYVAIGLTLPTEKLHVSGNVLASGRISAVSGLSASGGITFNAPISSTRLPRFTSAAFETKVANFTPSNADNGKVFLVNHTSKTAVTVSLDNLNIGWRAKFIAINSGAISFSSSFGTVYGAYGADGANTQPSLLDPIVEVICYDTNLYFAG